MNDEKPNVPPTPETFGLVVQAVFDTQRTLGEMGQRFETFTANQDRQHQDSQEMQKGLAEMRALVKYGAWLLVALAGVTAWLIEKIWVVLLPFLQAKGHP